MTIEPKFVPNNAIKTKIDDFGCNIRLIDCVGYLINSACPTVHLKSMVKILSGSGTEFDPYVVGL